MDRYVICNVSAVIAKAVSDAYLGDNFSIQSLLPCDKVNHVKARIDLSQAEIMLINAALELAPEIPRASSLGSLSEPYLPESQRAALKLFHELTIESIKKRTQCDSLYAEFTYRLSESEPIANSFYPNGKPYIDSVCYFIIAPIVEGTEE